jgi:hypothetical protein
VIIGEVEVKFVEICHQERGIAAGERRSKGFRNLSLSTAKTYAPWIIAEELSLFVAFTFGMEIMDWVFQGVIAFLTISRSAVNMNSFILPSID